MKRFISIAILFIFCTCLSAHPWKPSNYVIVDTDGGIDDMKAISMMLASKDVQLLAIIASSGALSADNVYLKVKSYLNSCYHEGIPVLINREVKYNSPNFENALNYKWGEEENIDIALAQNYYNVVSNIIETEQSEIRFVALGGLSSAATILQNMPTAKEKLRDIVWSSRGSEVTSGFNYSIDIESTKYILQQTDVDLNIVIAAGDTNNLFYDNNIIHSLQNSNTRYGLKLYEFLASAGANDEYSKLFVDELVATYLHYPQHFSANKSGNITEHSYNNLAEQKQDFITLINGKNVEENQLIETIPTDPLFYHDDVQPYVTDIIAAYGMEEWTSGIIAGELHRHLGVFALIGVKMGIRAREYFSVGVDEFVTKSYAGSVPPISCMNDGIQVSTGSTLGHGLITVVNDTPARAVADFTYGETTIRVSLKQEIFNELTSELQSLNRSYGLESDLYWDQVRINALDYWLKLDRYKIFDIEVL